MRAMMHLAAVCARSMYVDFQEHLQLIKADIDSAFRRIPLAPDARKFARVAYKYKGAIYTAEHLCAPFGAISSVHHWDRIGQHNLCAIGTQCHRLCAPCLAGCLLQALACRILKIPLLRHVDDYFTGLREYEAEHALQAFARYAI